MALQTCVRFHLESPRDLAQTPGQLGVTYAKRESEVPPNLNLRPRDLVLNPRSTQLAEHDLPLNHRELKGTGRKVPTQST